MKDNDKADDILQIYFDQIKAYPLLTQEQEFALGQRIRSGDNDALHSLIRSNLRLVVKVARGYISADIPFMDLIQEGNLGLMHAAEKFDDTKKIRFCTYASWWIRQFIARYLTNKRRMVRLPHRKEEMLRKIQQTYHSLSQLLMHQPRTEDIANELGVSVHDVDFIINMSTGPLSLEFDPGREDCASVMETHEDYTYCPERNLMRQYYREETRRLLNNLKSREKQVLSYRYQLKDGTSYTLKEIGDKMDLSPETVRQVEKRALAKIRRHAADLEHGLMEVI